MDIRRIILYLEIEFVLGKPKPRFILFIQHEQIRGSVLKV
jgi:hypothetical protein